MTDETTITTEQHFDVGRRFIHRHPFPDGWIPNRLDMGLDGTFHGKFHAPFAGHVIYAGIFNGWSGSHGLIIKAAPEVEDVNWWCPTRCLYLVEGIIATVPSGYRFNAGQPIAKHHPSPYGNSYGHGADGAIEFGVAEDGPEGSQTNAHAIRLGVGSSAARRMVLNFNDGVEKALGMAGAISTGNAGRP